jgi:very-short-patch-repair endonuclease
VPNHFARHLRRNVTDAERKLWHELRMLKHEGRHFRRQAPIAGFIADFACYKCRLVIELDGGQHNAPEGLARDRDRSKLLEPGGFRVLRFWNVDVFENPEGVIDMIRHAAGLPTSWSYESDIEEQTSTPNPSRKGEGHRGNMLMPPTTAHCPS